MRSFLFSENAFLSNETWAMVVLKLSFSILTFEFVWTLHWLTLSSRKPLNRSQTCEVHVVNEGIAVCAFIYWKKGSCHCDSIRLWCSDILFVRDAWCTYKMMADNSWRMLSVTFITIPHRNCYWNQKFN